MQGYDLSAGQDSDAIYIQAHKRQFASCQTTQLDRSLGELFEAACCPVHDLQGALMKLPQAACHLAVEEQSP